jgi:hypothetical protein
VSGSTPDLRQVLVRRRDGSFLLFLWRDVDLWDPAREVRLEVPARSLRVTLGRPATVQTFRPSTSASAQSTVSGTSVPVTLRGEVLALRISPS